MSAPASAAAPPSPAAALIQLALSASPAQLLDHLKNVAASSESVTGADEHGVTALHVAAHRGANTVAAALLERGARADAADAHGLRPLHVAARSGSLETVQALLAAGAPVHAADHSRWTATHYAAAHNHVTVLRTLTGRAGLPPSDPAAPTPLHLAAAHGHGPAVQALLEAGADPFVKVGEPPLPPPLALLQPATATLGPAPAPTSSPVLATDMLQLLRAGTAADIRIRVGDHALPAHRALLAARSGHFRAVFSNAASSPAELAAPADVSRDAVAALLEAVYTGDSTTLTEGGVQLVVEVGHLAVTWNCLSALAAAQRAASALLAPATALSFWRLSNARAHPLGEALSAYAAELVIRNATQVSSAAGSTLSGRDVATLIAQVPLRRRTPVAPPAVGRPLASPGAAPHGLTTSSGGLKKARTSDTGLAGPSADMEALKQGRMVLENIRKERVAWPFLEPVDHVRLGIPDYPLIIKQPMDISTIKKRYKNYRTLADFQTDMRLMFKNALTYNQAGSEICRGAVQLLELGERQLSRIADTCGVQLAPMPPELQQLMHNTKVAPLPAPLPPPAAVAAPPRRAAAPPPAAPRKVESAPTAANNGSGASSGSGELSRDEKRILGERIQALQGEQLERVLEIMASSANRSQMDDAGDEVEIDMEDLDTATLRRLQAYVDQCLAPKPTGATGAGAAGAKRRRDDEDVDVTQ